MAELEIRTAANLLVVDDDHAARSALVELLRSEGIAVRSAADGFKALGQLDDWTAHRPAGSGRRSHRRLRR